MKLTVLFITRKWPPAIGGMEVYCEELVRELRDRCEVELYALPGRPDGRPPSFLTLMGFALRSAARLLCGRTRHQVVHGGDMAVWPLVLLARIRRRGLRFFLSAHGTDVSFAHYPGLLARLYATYLKLGAVLLRRVQVVANSEATASLCRESGFRSVVVVPLATRRYGEARDISPEPFVLFVGRLIARKGCAWFIRNVLPRLDGSLRLVVAGTALSRDERSALEHPRVDFRGPLTGPELACLRQTGVVVVVPNIGTGIDDFEGFGLAAVEGASAGGVVLASRLHGIPEAVRDNESGFLLPPGDAAAWAAKIEEVRLWTPEQRRSFVEHSRAVVASVYSWSRVVEQTLAAYRANDRRCLDSKGA